MTTLIVALIVAVLLFPAVLLEIPYQMHKWRRRRRDRMRGGWWM